MSKKLMEVIMGLDVSIFMRGYQGYRFMYLYINSLFSELAWDVFVFGYIYECYE